jgi:biotin carboxylase
MTTPTLLTVASSQNLDLLKTPLDMSMRVVLVAKEPPADRSLYHLHLPADERDVHQVRTAVDAYRRGGGQIDAVACFHEGSLHVAAALAADLGLPGNSPEAVTNARDKHRTAQVLAAAGLATPRTELVTSPQRAVDACEKLGLPAVIKPRSSASSQGVTKVRNRAEAQAAFTAVDDLHRRHEFRQGPFAVPNIAHIYLHPDAQGVLVQEYIDGPEFAVDLVYGGGAYEVLAVHAKPTDWQDTYFIERTYLTPPQIPEADEKILCDTAVAALRALGATVGGAHVEIRLAERGPTVIEVNLRLGGTTAYVQESILASTGAWGPREYLRAVVGERPDRGHDRRPAGFTALLAEHTGRIDGFVGVEETRAIPGVAGIRWMAKPGDHVVIQYPANPVSCFALVLATGETADEVLHALQCAERTLRPVMTVMTPHTDPNPRNQGEHNVTGARRQPQP